MPAFCASAKLLCYVGRRGVKPVVFQVLTWDENRGNDQGGVYDMQDQIKIFQEYIEKAESTVFFGGAGVSTESGIPDFRSKDGLYNQHDVQFEKYQPEYLLSHSCLVSEPKVYFEFHRQKMEQYLIGWNLLRGQ